MAVANFQTAVSKYPAKGAPGDKATLNPFVYTDRNFVALTSGTTPVTVGNFVWSNVDNTSVDVTNTTGVYEAVAVQSAAIANSVPLGIVQRNLSYVNYNILDGGTLAVPDKAPLNVVIYGDMYVVSTTAAAIGDKVAADPTTGAIVTGATPTGTPTEWVVVEPGAAGDLIVISSWANRPASA